MSGRGSWRRASRVIAVGAALSPGILPPGAVRAQEAELPGSREPEPLTLAAAVALALENSPLHVRAVNAVSAAQEEERRSLGQMLPSLSASVDFRGSTSRTRTAFDDFGQPKESPSFERNTTSSTSQGLGGDLAVFDLAAIRRYGLARARTSAEELAVARDAAALRTSVGRAYFNLVQRRELIGVEVRVLRTAEDQLSAIRELLRVAAKQPTDVLGAELAVAQAEQSLASARGEARKAALVLNQAMGVPLERAFAPTDGFPALFDPVELDVAALVDRAVSGSPTLAEAEARAAAAERAVAVARAARFPSVRLDYSWGRSASLSEYTAFRELNPGNSSWGFGLRVGIPLFTGLQTAATVAGAALDADNARAGLREARLGLEGAVRAAVIDLSNGYQAVQLAERSAGIARERLAQGQELYRRGTLDYVALSQMSEQVADAERHVLDAHHQFAEALLQLEEKVAGPVGAGG